MAAPWEHACFGPLGRRSVVAVMGGMEGMSLRNRATLLCRMTFRGLRQHFGRDRQLQYYGTTFTLWRERRSTGLVFFCFVRTRCSFNRGTTGHHPVVARPGGMRPCPPEATCAHGRAWRRRKLYIVTTAAVERLGVSGRLDQTESRSPGRGSKSPRGVSDLFYRTRRCFRRPCVLQG